MNTVVDVGTMLSDVRVFGYGHQRLTRKLLHECAGLMPIGVTLTGLCLSIIGLAQSHRPERLRDVGQLSSRVGQPPPAVSRPIRPCDMNIRVSEKMRAVGGGACAVVGQ
jgi:hypothetical protein